MEKSPRNFFYLLNSRRHAELSSFQSRGLFLNSGHHIDPIKILSILSNFYKSSLIIYICNNSPTLITNSYYALMHIYEQYLRDLRVFHRLKIFRPIKLHTLLSLSKAKDPGLVFEKLTDFKEKSISC